MHDLTMGNRRPKFSNITMVSSESVIASLEKIRGFKPGTKILMDFILTLDGGSHGKYPWLRTEPGLQVLVDAFGSLFATLDGLSQAGYRVSVKAGWGLMMYELDEFTEDALKNWKDDVIVKTQVSLLV